MLEETLQQERAGMQALRASQGAQMRSGAAEDVLISHPLSELSTPSEHFLPDKNFDQLLPSQRVSMTARHPLCLIC